MDHKISPQTKRDVLEALCGRYGQASRMEKSQILDEFVAIAGCHRKHAIRLLSSDGPVSSGSPVPGDPPVHGRRIYSEAVREALVVLWEAADRICGKRLKAILPGLISAMERHKHLSLDPTVRELVLSASPATIDRLLNPIRSGASQGTKRRRATKPSKQIPIRTFADWNEPEPGFLEIDFVSHGGSSMRGVFLWSLVATDVCSGWVEMLPLVAREQSLVVEGLSVLRRQFPMPIRGIDSDNDSALHQRDTSRLLPGTEDRIYPFASLPEERPSLDRAKERRGYSAIRGLRALHGAGCRPVSRSSIPDGSSVRELFSAIVQAFVENA